MSAEARLSFSDSEISDSSVLEVNDQNDNTSDDNDSYSIDNMENGFQYVDIEFEGRAPFDPDIHGISQMLQRVFLKSHIDTLQMAEIIVAQNFVGSVIGQCASDAEDDDVLCESDTIFGITTLINITAKKGVQCIQLLRSFILQKAELHAIDTTLKQFQQILDDNTSNKTNVGYLINERFINIPAQIVIPLLENLHKEINMAIQKGMKFDCDYYIMILKLHRLETINSKPSEDIFINAEEELLAKKALSHFIYSVSNESDAAMSGNWLEEDNALVPYRMVILLDGKQLPNFIADIRKFVKNE